MNGLLVPNATVSKLLLIFTLVGAMAVSPGIAQVNPPRSRPPVPPPQQGVQAPSRPVPEGPVPGNPDYAPDQTKQGQVVAPAPVPQAPVLWDVQNAQALLHAIRNIGVEGLNPSDYDPDGLEASIQANDYYAMSAAATQRFDQLSSDLALGHVKKPARIDWFVADNDLNAQSRTYF